MTESFAKEIVRQFEIPGEVTEVAPIKVGHVNETFVVTAGSGGEQRRYTFQKINTYVFRDPERLMENMWRVTEHMRGRIGKDCAFGPDRSVLRLVPTRDGQRFLRTPADECWRAYVYIENARTFDVVRDTAMSYEAARTFAQFQLRLADLPPPPLHETIPFFHDTPRRLAALERAIGADPEGRKKACQPEIDFALGFKDSCDRVVRDLRDGSMPLRVTHNDTKINNVLFDDATGRGMCVLDLDTVMPGSLLYDFGDQVRSSVGHFEENERDLDKVFADMERFDALVRGWLDEAGPVLAPAEIDGLCFAGELITMEIGMRFLADHLEGDRYFRIHRPGENLDRARTQFALVRSLRQQRKEMERIVARAKERIARKG